jgi:hypothetical protein
MLTAIADGISAKSRYNYFMDNTATKGRFPTSQNREETSLAFYDILETEMNAVHEDSDASFPQLNDSEAGNIAFILSDRFSRNGDWNISLDMEGGEPSMNELADKVSRRLEELSLRLGDDHDVKRLEGSGL